MITEAIHAWVLHKRWSGETSAQITFFSRESGIIIARYKGGRTPQKQAQLQAFTPLWLTLDKRREWNYVRLVEMAGPTLIFPKTNLFAALYCNELLYYGLRPHDPDEDLYTAYIDVLQCLTLAHDKLILEAALRRFEWAFLINMGYHITLTDDSRLGVPVQPFNYYMFIAGEGVTQADSGILGAHLLAFAANHLDDVEVLKMVKKMMRCAIDHALDGRPINARLLYNKNKR